ncbi:hypothetical protein EHS25_007305 [Saitozyma podzolica]|uniref:Mandelate racemase/muconate lactonizing enzyme C-terminal domain-containing protein n=1 Tax=Saitozyma podzolica TaxID=1890683 RepID=A0A427XMQ7_9TREE|nr:hypothetical protein EHS25_007305 [Saitozyma podzolica]
MSSHQPDLRFRGLNPTFNFGMKIKSIRTTTICVPLGDKVFHSSQARFPARNSCLVRIETDSGLIGWGEGGQHRPPQPVAACLNHVLGPKILGRDPTEPVRTWEELYSFSRDFGQKGTYIEALSAIDIALWDISGKALGVPVWKLLGGAFRRKIKSYATGYRDAGFDFVKVKIGLLDIRSDAERLRVIRQSLGPDVGIMVDANHGYSAATAIRMGRLMEPYSILFFEEPVVPEDREGNRRVRMENPIPVAGGEAEFTRYGFRDLIGGGCVDVAQPDLTVCGGFTAFTQILALANAHGTIVIPHVWGSGIAFAAALQAIPTIPPIPHTANPIPLQNEPVIEFDRTHNPLRDELLNERFALVDGHVLIPDGPGLGISVNDEVLTRYSS